MNCSLNGHPSYPLAYSRYRDIWWSPDMSCPHRWFLTLVSSDSDDGNHSYHDIFPCIGFFRWYVQLCICTSRGINLSSRLAQVHIIFLCIFRCWEPRRQKPECSTVSFFAPGARLIVSDRMLSYSLGCAAASTLSGLWVSRTGQYRPTMWAAYAVSTVGLGVMCMLDGTSSTYVYKMRKDLWLT